MNHNEILPVHKLNRLVRIDEVVLITGFKKSTIYWKMKEGLFPKPKKIGDRAVA
jgi:prophage regulatory protein